MLQRIRSLLTIIAEGSVNRAARRLGVAQPTLSRHIQSLEQELGAPLFERGAWGMRPTGFGFFIRDKFAPIVRDYDFARAEALAFAQGRHQQLRVGYLGLAAARCLNPALATLRREFRGVKLMLFDQTPGEQLAALREGRIDVALVGQEGAAQGEEFYCRRAARLGVRVALPAEHPLAGTETLSLRQLKAERFVGVAEQAVPGRNQWITGLCAKAGFRPRFLAQTGGITETFALVAGEDAVALLPDYMEGPPPPGVAYARLSDSWATWTLSVLRQRGRGSPAAVRLVELIGS
jgi:DNA-binding transcriptional LysR family regulator